MCNAQFWYVFSLLKFEIYGWPRRDEGVTLTWQPCMKCMFTLDPTTWHDACHDVGAADVQNTNFWAQCPI